MSKPDTARFDFRPHHAMCALAVLWVVLALLTWPGIGCWFAAAAYLCAWAYTRHHQTVWPADVQAACANRGWALPRDEPAPDDRNPPIPFRPMTIAELYAGVVKIVWRNWPTLIGVPAVILTGLVVALVAATQTVEKVMGSPQLAGMVVGGGGDLRPGAVALIVVVALAFLAAMLPGDGLMISIATKAADCAVRGQPIRFDEMFHRAKRRKYAVGRLTGTYYLILTVMLVVQVVAASSVFYTALVPTLVVGGLASVFVSILLCLSPVVLVLEKRGFADSFRRSIEICRPAVGRVIAINLVWIVAVTPVVVLSVLFPTVTPVVVLVIVPVVFGVVRCLQMLVYADLRMRQDNYGQELRTAWARNTGAG